LGAIQSALDKLTRLAKEMDDEGLVQAIHDGRNELEGSFFWTGIDRE
jgi:hypothetical protein